MEIKLILVIFHIIGVALGLGGATISDVLFFYSVKNKTISGDEVNLLRAVSKVIWTGIILLIVTGIGFLVLRYLTAGSINGIELLHNGRFQTKMFIVAVIFINGLVFHFKVFPLIRKYTGLSLQNDEIKKRLPLFAATGAISIISWYSALFLAFLKFLTYSFAFLVNIYLLIIFVGIIFAYFSVSHSFFPRR